jgi:glycerol kinase
MTPDLVLAIDQGTSSTRAIAYDASWTAVATASRRLAVAHPQPGWAEQDPDEILASVVDTVADVLAAVGGPGRIAAAGLANQGETVVAWDAETREPLAPAVVWHCRRSQAIVDRVAATGRGDAIREKTGLPLDPYFSAGKIRWLLEEVPAIARAAARGSLRVGTVDAWLTARLGSEPRTDSSTASRTQLFALRPLAWDDDLLAWWDVPRDVLPVVGPSIGDLGTLSHARWGGALPLGAMLCDQQAALLGHGGQRSGTIKATYGTGVFVLATSGATVPAPLPGILTTVGWTDSDRRTTYALDGGVFSAGSLLDWLHSGVGLIDEPARLDELASGAPDSGGVRILPALAGLGAPWWEPGARGVVAGLSSATGRSHVARAAIDAIAQRVADIVEAMSPGVHGAPARVRVDGGLTASGLLVQRQADLLGCVVEVAAEPESTALGVALMAAVGVGRLSQHDAEAVPRTARRVEPTLPAAERHAEREAWQAFVTATATLEPGTTKRRVEPPLAAVRGSI